MGLCLNGRSKLRYILELTCFDGLRIGPEWCLSVVGVVVVATNALCKVQNCGWNSTNCLFNP